MSIASAITTAQGRVAAAYTACNAKGATMPATQDLSNLPATIATISGGGGGGGTTTRATASKVMSAAGNTITFTSLAGEPQAWLVTPDSVTYSGSTVMSALGDSSVHNGVYTTGTQHNYSSGFSASYNAGSFTVTAPTGINWGAGTYSLVYYYGGDALTFRQTTIAPGSGVTAVTFTDAAITEVPAMFAVYLESAVNSESYRRVGCYLYDGNTAFGRTFYSQQIADTTTSFSHSYTTGLYVNSGGTNAGGYFHNPGTYRLYYLMASDVEGGGGGGGGANLGTLSVTPSTSAQHLTPSSPLDGWDEVDVAAIQTQTKSATPSTSAQTVTPDTGKFLTQVSISAVTSSIDANIQAGNIKSGTTILGVTGNYTGGGSATVASATASVGSSNVSSLSFTLSGSPKMFAVILQLASSGSYLTNSSTSVYDITAVISDGTNQYAICSRYNSSGTRAAREYYYTNYTKSYNNGTLTITATTGVFVANNTYRIIYVY